MAACLHSMFMQQSRFSLRSWGELYQHLFNGISSFEELGNRLIQKAECAKALRRTEVLEEIVSMLASFPVREYQLIGQYYKGLSEYLKGGKPQQIFETVLEKSSSYKAKALIGLAALEAQKGNYESELQLFTQASKFANSPSLYAEIHRSISVVRAKEGFHKQALGELESMFPYIRHADLYAYCQYLNSYAVELGEVGRIEEAQNVCNIVLASPFINAYPEWRETGAGIALRGYKSRSVVLVPELPLKVKDNVVPLPVVERSPSLPQQERAKVLDLQAWIEKMVKEQNDDPNGENIDEMDRKDLLVKLLELTADVDIDEEKLRKVVKYTVEVMTKK